MKRLTPREVDQIDWTPIFRDATQTYNRLVDATKISDWAQRQRKLHEIRMELQLRKNETEDEPWVDYIFPHFPSAEAGRKIRNKLGIYYPVGASIQATADQGEQMRRNLLVAFALAGYRADHGRYPPTLTDLAPKYLATIPDDLFTGKPLLYEPAENGYRLYSKGASEPDENGRLNDNLRVHMGKEKRK